MFGWGSLERCLNIPLVKHYPPVLRLVFLLSFTPSWGSLWFLSVTRLLWGLPHALFPERERGHDPGSFMLSSEAQAMPGKEGELTGAEESAEFTQKAFLGEVVL